MKEMQTVERVVRQPVERVLSWLAAADRTAVPVDFNWLGLAEAAARKGRLECDLDWALVALRSYGRWLGIAGPSAYESYRVSTMSLRAYFIKRFGAEDGDELRDLTRLVDAFRDGIDESPVEISTRVRQWERLGPLEILELRRIKDRLTPLTLLESRTLIAFPDIAEWLRIREQLP
jgi:hypothetical protein